MYIETIIAKTANFAQESEKGIWRGIKSEGEVIFEKRQILFATDGYNLVRKSDGENVGNSVWLKNGDSQENYVEIEMSEEQ